MPSEWFGVHGGRSYGPSPRGSSEPGPAVAAVALATLTLKIKKNNFLTGYCTVFVLEVVPRQRRVPPFFIEVYS